ncbi:MAG: ADP-ribosylation factor-like protein [Candidatus Sigynarchaeota archaeon]
MNENQRIIQALILSIFGDEGPIPEMVLINEENGIRVIKKENVKELYNPPLDLGTFLHISMKSISLLMGERVYQESEGDRDDIKAFGILPFPDIKMDGLTYFFLIPDQGARGSARASTITILVLEEHKNFFYDNMAELRSLIVEHAIRIKKMLTQDEFVTVMVDLFKAINEFAERKVAYPLSSKRSLKIVFAGLDNSGKTSMILGLEKKYSNLAQVQPTKGVARSQSAIMGLTISIWDLGGQDSYRTQYVKDAAELYLFDIDLLFYLIDVRDDKRFEESVDYYKQILAVLAKFEQNPPIILCLHKSETPQEPDGQVKLKKNIEAARELFSAASEDFSVKFFETSIFEPYSLATAFSYGLAALSPNRDIFRYQLEKLAKQSGARGILLVNEKGLIMSDYAVDEESGKLFELSAPHFTAIYNNFENFVSGKATRASYMIENTIITFHVLDCQDFKVYVLAFLTDKSAVDKIEKHLTEFRDNVKGLIKEYI